MLPQEVQQSLRLRHSALVADEQDKQEEATKNDRIGQTGQQRIQEVLRQAKHKSSKNRRHNIIREQSLIRQQTYDGVHHYQQGLITTKTSQQRHHPDRFHDDT